MSDSSSGGSQTGGKGSTGRRMMQMWNLFSGITSSSSESILVMRAWLVIATI